MSKADEFIQQYQGDMTPEQAAALLELAEQGDTGAASPEPGSAPDATPQQDEPNAQEQEGGSQDGANAGGEPEPDPSNTVVLAKDGVHTIPYETLQQARENERQWREKHSAAMQELEALRANAQQRSDDGQAPTQTDVNAAIAEQAIAQGFDPGIFGDFSEEDLANGVQKLVDMRVDQRVAEQVKAALADVIGPLKQQQEQDATKAHFDTIYAAHPDADSIAESKELADWIARQPSFARAGFEAVLKQGTAAEVVEMLDAFKHATGRTQPATPDVKAAARAAAAKAEPPVPSSLSDIPGGAQGPASQDEAMRQMDAPALAERMASMTPEQIEQFLSRSL